MTEAMGDALVEESTEELVLVGDGSEPPHGPNVVRHAA